MKAEEAYNEMLKYFDPKIKDGWVWMCFEKIWEENPEAAKAMVRAEYEENIGKREPTLKKIFEYEGGAYFLLKK